MVRKYLNNDLHEILLLFHAAVHEIASKDYTQMQLSAWAPESPDLLSWSNRLNSGVVFVNEINSQIAGFGRIDEIGYVDLLFVHPKFQRQGIGHSIINHMIKWAKENAIKKIYSEVSLTAVQFFTNNDFSIYKEQVVERRGVKFKNFLMERDLLEK